MKPRRFKQTEMDTELVPLEKLFQKKVLPQKKVLSQKRAAPRVTRPVNRRLWPVQPQPVPMKGLLYLEPEPKPLKGLLDVPTTKRRK